MYKYENRNLVVRCSFCGKNGHNIRTCQIVEEAAADHLQWKYDAAQRTRALTEMARRNKIQKEAKKRSAPRCGFCGRKKHNRKNCPKKKKVLKDLYRANRRWRLAFVERVNTLGVGEGALVELTGVPIAALANPAKAFTHNRKDKHVGIVKGYDWDSLNLFCGFGGSYDYRSKSSILVQIATKTGFLSIDIGKYIGDDLFLSRSFFPYYTRLTVPSPATIPEGLWPDEKEIPCIDWLVQTHSFDDLKNLDIIKYIEKWT